MVILVYGMLYGRWLVEIWRFSPDDGAINTSVFVRTTAARDSDLKHEASRRTEPTRTSFQRIVIVPKYETNCRKYSVKNWVRTAYKCKNKKSSDKRELSECYASVVDRESSVAAILDVYVRKCTNTTSVVRLNRVTIDYLKFFICFH